MSEFPHRLADNPQKWEEYVRSFDAPMIATAIVGTVVMTLVAEIATWLLRGHAAADGRFGIVLPWVLVLAIAVTALASQRQMRHQGERRIPLSCWAFGTLQMLWMIGLAWYSSPEFSVVLAAALWAVAFHDARYFYDAIWLRLHYLLVWTNNYQGYGIGLTLAKLLLVRNNGWLAVAAPAEGPGLVFRVVLPRVLPADIPVAENCPERLAEGSPDGTHA